MILPIGAFIVSVLAILIFLFGKFFPWALVLQRFIAKFMAVVCGIYAIRTIFVPFLFYKDGCTLEDSGKSCVNTGFILYSLFQIGLCSYLSCGLWRFEKWAWVVTVILLVLVVGIRFSILYSLTAGGSEVPFPLSLLSMT